MSTKHGKGSIQQVEKDKPKNKCRKWRITISMGKDPRTGKYFKKNRIINGTYSDASRALEQLLEEAGNGLIVPRHKVTLDEYRKDYKRRRKASGRVAPNTVEGDDMRIKAICFLIGETHIQDISSILLEQTYARLLQGESPSGRKLSCTYVSDCAIALSTMMDDAKNHGLIGDNPCAKATKPKRDTAEKKVIDQASIRLLIAMLDCKNHMEISVLLCTMLGLRRGEVVGLSWEDVDFENNMLHINHSYDALGNLRPTKTKAGRRIIPMTPAVREALLERKQAQAEAFRRIEARQQKLGADGFTLIQGPHTAVVSDDYGQRILPDGLTHWWRKNRSRFGLEEYTLHQLRHSFITNAILNGISPSVVQELAGHASPEVTMSIYTHVNTEAKLEAMRLLSQTY